MHISSIVTFSEFINDLLPSVNDQFCEFLRFRSADELSILLGSGAGATSLDDWRQLPIDTAPLPRREVNRSSCLSTLPWQIQYLSSRYASLAFNLHCWSHITLGLKLKELKITHRGSFFLIKLIFLNEPHNYYALCKVVSELLYILHINFMHQFTNIAH